jgi:hypothetical protein
LSMLQLSLVSHSTRMCRSADFAWETVGKQVSGLATEYRLVAGERGIAIRASVGRTEQHGSSHVCARHTRLTMSVMVYIFSSMAWISVSGPGPALEPVRPTRLGQYMARLAKRTPLMPAG